MIDRPMKAFRRTVLIAVFFVMFGCTGRSNKESIDVAPAAPPRPYSSTDRDELLRFAGKFAGLSAEARLEECEKMRQTSQTSPGLGVRLHLLLAESATGACGEPRNPVAAIDASLAEIRDEKLKSFLIYHKAVLARLDREKERRKSLEKRILQIRSKEKNATRRLKSQESELKALQDKLDALKAIEDSLDEPNDGH
jgi:hypothetical protein